MTARTLRRTLAVALLLPMASVQAQGVDIRIPDSIGAFHLAGRKNYESASAGFMLRYRRADGLTGDVFIYPGPDLRARCDTACARGVIQREGDDFVALIPEMIRRQYADTIVVLGDEPLAPGAGAAWRLGRRITLRERVKGDAEWSDLVLYYLPGFRVKIRATYAPDSLAASAIAQFAAAVPDALAANSSRRSVPRDSAAIRVSGDTGILRPSSPRPGR